MSRRKKILTGTVITIIACAVVAVIVDLPRVDDFKVTKENFDRLHVGMSHAEVNAVLGHASDHYHPEKGRGWVWEGAEGNAYILFGVDGNGPVSELSWADWGRSPEERAKWEREHRAWQRERRWNLRELQFRTFINSMKPR
jgi:hypothetical protein